MFTTTDEVLSLTGKSVEDSTIIMAQSLVETFVGRTEVDVTKPSDRQLMGKAVVYQAAYMQENPEVVFDQVALESLTQGDSTTKFDLSKHSPYMSPWAVMACSKLSWNGNRSIRTGKTLGSTQLSYSWTHDIGEVYR